MEKYKYQNPPVLFWRTLLIILIASAGLTSCKERTYLGPDHKGDLGYAPTYDNDVTYGDTIYYQNGDIITYQNNGNLIFGGVAVQIGDVVNHNGNNFTWNGSFWIGNDQRSYVWDQSTNTWAPVTIGTVVYDQSQSYTWNGSYWIGDDNSSYIYDSSTNTFMEITIGTVIYDSSTTVTHTYNGMYWTGDDNRSYVYDNSTSTFMEITIGTVVNDLSQSYTWNGAYWIGDDNGTYMYDNSTNTFMEITIGTVVYDSSTTISYTYNGMYWIGDDNSTYTYSNTSNHWNLAVAYICSCAPICQTDTMVVDSIIIIYPSTHVILEASNVPSDAVRASGTIETGLSELNSKSGAAGDTLRFLHQWQGPLFGTMEQISTACDSGHWVSNALIGEAQAVSLHLQMLPIGGTIDFCSMLTNGNGGSGPLMAKAYEVTVMGTQPVDYNWPTIHTVKFGTIPAQYDNISFWAVRTDGLVNGYGSNHDISVKGYISVPVGAIYRDYSEPITYNGAANPAAWKVAQ